MFALSLWQGFGAGRCRDGFWEKRLGAAPCWPEPISGGSRADTAQPKLSQSFTLVAPLSVLGKGCEREEGETALQISRPEGGKQGGAAGAGEETLVKHILPLKCMKDHGGVDIHPAALGALKEAGVFRSRFSARTHTRALHS